MQNDSMAMTSGCASIHGMPDRSGFLPEISLPFAIPAEPLAIADMADLFGVTHRTLHFYEEKGLICASRSGSMRVYGNEHIRRMAVINACREIGISVAAIQDLMEELARTVSRTEANNLFHATLTRRKRELTADVSHISRQIQQIETLLATDDKDGGPAIAGRSALHALTEPERQCLALMAEGYSAPRLARALDLTSEDLAVIENAIIRKFGATNRFQAVAKALLLGIVLN
jgi:DNA-binding transcriptional MerR regulator